MTSRILIGSSQIDVTLPDADWRASRDELYRWIRAAAESVATFYGRYPVPHLDLRVRTFDGPGVRGGRTFGDQDGTLIQIRVGTHTTAAELNNDWTLTHEMIHLGFPSVGREHEWLEEGIATYAEPIARVQAGHLEAARMWFELVRDIPQGLPEAGDQGLDHTHTWARTYWGGALFCLLADVEFRRQTKNRKGLQDALRGILNAGGDIRADWDIETALRTADKAAGIPVLIPLYNKMRDSPTAVDLDDLWKRLGISYDGKRVTFSDNAPLAEAREAITAAAPGSGRSAAPARPIAVFAGNEAGPLAPHRRTASSQ